MREQLNIEVRPERDRTVLALHGELDLLAAPRLQSELESDAVDAAAILVLDLDDVQFMDSAGLRVVLAAHERKVERGQRVVVTLGSPQVQRLLSLAGVSGHLHTIASADAALV
ncbi:MAG TPA: STAS domain-containing protein [Solirubrobacteraceae bacterium]|jgi:anti-anti-sigma factor|nr:STAS domain-containing protein [Solirubrobacteraceae bacterium]